MRIKKYAVSISAAVGMLILILDGKTALTGARTGILLCVQTLIPSLFPYLVLSTLLTSSLTGRSPKLLRPIGKITGMPEGSEALLTVGILGGYPVGALNVALAWRRGQLSRPDAERLLTFCNNAGPSFLFGMIAPMFSEAKTSWLLWGVHIISAILVGRITLDKPHSVGVLLSREISLTEALEQAVRTMSTICGWVVLFRIIICFLDRWFLWMLPADIRVFLCGTLELSNGCIQLAVVSCEGLRFVIAGALLSLGGICVTMQTASAASGLSLRRYFPAKLLQCCFSFLLCVMLQGAFSDRWHCPPIFLSGIAAAGLLLGLYLKRNKKMGSIPALVGV